MSILGIKVYPDPVLRETSAVVKNIDDQVRELINNMAETMYIAPGIGLAAPQVGILSRIIIADIGNITKTSEKLIGLINPVIIQAEGEIIGEEGCLSVPDYSANVKRANKVTVSGFTKDETEIKIDAEGLLAIVFQHEIDHLNGILFIDHLSKLKQSLFKKKIQKKMQLR